MYTATSYNNMSYVSGIVLSFPLEWIHLLLPIVPQVRSGIFLFADEDIEV